jgi:hypothetical protein
MHSKNPALYALHHTTKEVTDLEEDYEQELHLDAIADTRLFEKATDTYSAGPRGRLYSTMLLSFHREGRQDEVTLPGKRGGRLEYANEVI